MDTLVRRLYRCMEGYSPRPCLPSTRLLRFLLVLLFAFNHVRIANGGNERASDAQAFSASSTSTHNLNERQNILPGVLGNNIPNQLNIAPGETQLWRFPKTVILGPLSPVPTGLPSELSQRAASHPDVRKRSDEQTLNQENGSDLGISERQQTIKARTVYVSITTCLQPVSNSTGNQSPPPQLHVSGSTQDPRNTRGDSSAYSLDLRDGYGSIEQADVTADYFVSVVAPAVRDLHGQWSYQIAASIDDYFHSYDSIDPFLHLIDSDSSSALLITDNLTQSGAGDEVYSRWVELQPPFEMFAVNATKSEFDGLLGSFCALQDIPLKASLQGNNDAFKEVSITVRGLGSKPKQQFHLKGLQPNSQYRGIMAMNGNSTKAGAGVVRGGGRIWKSVDFMTKADGNCQVLFDLPFCNETAYAVPANPASIQYGELASLYDRKAQDLYLNFSMSLEQVACQTEREAQYSLVKTCDHCRQAYKQWLCAVTIPRCEDFSSQKSFLMPRNVGQAFLNGSSTSALFEDLATRPWTSSSRSEFVDHQIRPGPYKEILPCKDLCHALVQSCPAVLQLSCPSQDRGLLRSYGERNDRGDITCSYLGAAYALSGASSTNVPIALILLGVLFVAHIQLLT